MESLSSSHEAEMSEIRAASSQMSSQLQHKSRSVAALKEKAAGMEQALRDKEEGEERKQAELTVSVCVRV